VEQVEIGKIANNRFQPRQNYDEARLAELVDSIREKGFLQPIVVRRAKEGYEVIAGERRLKAARKLGLSQVPVIVKEATDKEALVLALVENVQREELNALEKAESYQRLIQEFGYSQEEVARSVGKDRATIANLVRLLKLPRDIQKGLLENRITEGHARAVLSLEDVNAQMVLFLEIVHKGLSVREAEARAKKMSKGRASLAKERPPFKDPEIRAMEEELRNIFGTKVAIHNKRGNKGRLVIEYYSLNDFDRILTVVRK
jgi:ParB family chromosome partitioning protein